jgi:hypothetical protein
MTVMMITVAVPKDDGGMNENHARCWLLSSASTDTDPQYISCSQSASDALIAGVLSCVAG